VNKYNSIDIFTSSEKETEYSDSVLDQQDETQKKAILIEYGIDLF
jgi:hypothetical protein